MQCFLVQAGQTQMLFEHVGVSVYSIEISLNFGIEGGFEGGDGKVGVIHDCGLDNGAYQ